MFAFVWQWKCCFGSRAACCWLFIMLHTCCCQLCFKSFLCFGDLHFCFNFKSFLCFGDLTSRVGGQIPRCIESCVVLIGSVVVCFSDVQTWCKWVVMLLHIAHVDCGGGHELSLSRLCSVEFCVFTIGWLANMPMTVQHVLKPTPSPPATLPCFRTFYPICPSPHNHKVLSRIINISHQRRKPNVVWCTVLSSFAFFPGAEQSIYSQTVESGWSLFLICDSVFCRSYYCCFVARLTVSDLQVVSCDSCFVLL